MSREREKWKKKKTIKQGEQEEVDPSRSTLEERKSGWKKKTAHNTVVVKHTPVLASLRRKLLLPRLKRKERKKKKTGKQKHRAGQGTRSEETAMLEKRNEKK